MPDPEIMNNKEYDPHKGDYKNRPKDDDQVEDTNKKPKETIK